MKGAKEIKGAKGKNSFLALQRCDVFTRANFVDYLRAGW